MHVIIMRGRVRCQEHIFHDGMAYKDPARDCLRCYEICRDGQNVMKRSCLSACEDQCPVAETMCIPITQCQTYQTHQTHQESEWVDKRTPAETNGAKFIVKLTVVFAIAVLFLCMGCVKCNNGAAFEMHLTLGIKIPLSNNVVKAEPSSCDSGYTTSDTQWIPSFSLYFGKYDREETTCTKPGKDENCMSSHISGSNGEIESTSGNIHQLDNYGQPPSDVSRTGNIVVTDHAKEEVIPDNYRQPPSDVSRTGNIAGTDHAKVEVIPDNYRQPPSDVSRTGYIAVTDHAKVEVIPDNYGQPPSGIADIWWASGQWDYLVSSDEDTTCDMETQTGKPRRLSEVDLLDQSYLARFKHCGVEVTNTSPIQVETEIECVASEDPDQQGFVVDNCAERSMPKPDLMIRNLNISKSNSTGTIFGLEPGNHNESDTNCLTTEHSAQDDRFRALGGNSDREHHCQLDDIKRVIIYLEPPVLASNATTYQNDTGMTSGESSVFISDTNTLQKDKQATGQEQPVLVSDVTTEQNDTEMTCDDEGESEDSNDRVLEEKLGSSIPIQPGVTTSGGLHAPSGLDDPGKQSISNPNNREANKQKVVPSRDCPHTGMEASVLLSAVQEKRSVRARVLQEQSSGIDLSSKQKGRDIGSDLTDKELRRQIRECTWLPLHRLPSPNISLSAFPLMAFAPLDDIFRQMVHDPNLGPRITMRYELLRLCTFREYPRNKPYSIRLAGAGFYYAADGDETVCYVCGVRRHGWNEKDNPRRIHAVITPNCKFLRSNDEVNVPVPSDYNKQLLESSLNGRLSLRGGQAAGNTVSTTATEETMRWTGSVIRPNAQSESAVRAGQTVDDESLTWTGTVSLTESSTAHAESPTAHAESQTARAESQTARAESPVTATSSMSARRLGPGHLSVSSNMTETPTSGVDTQQPKHPHYAVKSVRLTSYAGWPKHLTQTPDIMAGAGYFYAGFGDCVRCFFCGIGLRHWTDEDNIWIEHARWSPTCQYLRQMKGQEFIDLVKLALQYTEEDVTEESGNAVARPQDPEARRQSEVSRLLLGDPAQSVLEMGYPPAITRLAITNTLNSRGAETITAQSLMEEVLNIEDHQMEQQMASIQISQSRDTTSASGRSRDTGYSSLSRAEGGKVRTRNVGKDTASIAMATDKRQVRKDSASTSKGSGKGSSHVESKTSTPKDKTAVEAKKIRAENRVLREQTLCKICLDKNVSIVFLPCGHLVTCAECAPALRKCPICRGLIKGSVKTYLS